jgi:hypothetical protein
VLFERTTVLVGDSPNKREGPRESVRGPKSRSYDDIALHLLSSWLGYLRCGSSNPYIGFHLLSDDPLAYSAKSLPAEREGKPREARRTEVLRRIPLPGARWMYSSYVVGVLNHLAETVDTSILHEREAGRPRRLHHEYIREYTTSTLGQQASSVSSTRTKRSSNDEDGQGSYPGSYFHSHSRC